MPYADSKREKKKNHYRLLGGLQRRAGNPPLQSFILTWAGWRWEQCALASAGDDDHTSEGSGEVPEAAEHALE